MNKIDYNECWNEFVTTGSVSSYLRYTLLKNKAGNDIGTDENIGFDTQNSQPER